LLLIALACSTEPATLGGYGSAEQGTAGSEANSEGSSSATAATGPTTTEGSAAGTNATSTTDEDGETSTPKFDIESSESGAAPSCTVVDDLDAVPDCTKKAPPNSFDPEFQWSWTDGSVVQVPLVANLTDDNDDGNIDLCDVPDVVVVRDVGSGSAPTPTTVSEGEIVVLDGATGVEHYRIPTTVDATMAPAIGDIDDDGIPEIVALKGDKSYTTPTPLIAFEHDGTTKWTSSHTINYGFGIALADVDNDGDVEIITNSTVTDHTGALAWRASVLPCNPLFLAEDCATATTAADLDGDQDLEIIAGNAAYHHDGTVYFQNGSIARQGGIGVFPHVADLDSDPEPEVLLVAVFGDIAILEHDGTTKVHMPAPIFPAVVYSTVTIHDFDGDGAAEFGVGVSDRYEVYQHDGSLAWSQAVTWSANEQSSSPGSTAFDFLGGGTAQAVYNDQLELFVYDGSSGDVLLQVDNATNTWYGFPIVADVDNDGSAEILVTSSSMDNAGVHAIRDREDRWIQARRIWNQHTYHVTNVREDGTIPEFEAPHWRTFNTFRTNAQIEGGLCKPPVG